MAFAHICGVLRAHPAGRPLLPTRPPAAVRHPAALDVDEQVPVAKMLRCLAVFTAQRPKVILIAVLALLGIGIVFGGTVSQKLGVGGFVAPASESTQVDDFVDKNFGTTPNLVLQVVARDRTVEDPAVTAAANRVRRLVEAEPAAHGIGSLTADA